MRNNYLSVAGITSFNNGDGLCYIDEQGKLCGFRVNRVEGNKLFPQEMPRIKPKTKLYRNFDQEFERQMQKKSAERKVAINMAFEENAFGFTLSLTDEDDNRISVTLPRAKEAARTPQTENLRNQLSKLGNTPFEAEAIQINLSADWFIPSSELADLRRRGNRSIISRPTHQLPATMGTITRNASCFPGTRVNVCRQCDEQIGIRILLVARGTAHCSCL